MLPNLRKLFKLRENITSTFHLMRRLVNFAKIVFRKTLRVSQVFLSGIFLFYSAFLSAHTHREYHMATPYSEAVFHTKVIRQFQATLANHAEPTPIKVHSGASLYKHGDIYRAVRTRQLAMGEIFLPTLANKHPIFRLDSIPFFATTFEEAWELYLVTKPVMKSVFAADGLLFLYALPWPPQGIYSQEPIRTVADFAGKHLRTYNPTTVDLALQLNAIPTTVQTPEIPQAFATQVIDTMITSAATGVSSQAWDFTEYYVDSRAWIPKNVVFMNLAEFNQLSVAQQKAVITVSAQVEQHGWQLAKQITEVQTTMLKDNGMQVEQVPVALQRRFIEIGENMVSQWQQDMSQFFGKNATRAVDELNEVLTAYRKKREALQHVDNP